MSKHDYGMFTESGNILVGGIVDTAIVNNFDYIWVKKKLELLSETPSFCEAGFRPVRDAAFKNLWNAAALKKGSLS